MSTPTDLNFNNQGGIYSAKLLHNIGVQRIPDVVFGTHRIDGAVVLNSGYAWEAPYFTESTANWTEQEKPMGTDSVFVQRVELLIPLHDHDGIYEQIVRERKRYLIDLTDRDGNRRLVGTKLQPLQLVHKFETERDPSGRKATVLVFEGETNERAYFYAPDAVELDYSSGSGS